MGLFFIEFSDFITGATLFFFLLRWGRHDFDVGCRRRIFIPTREREREKDKHFPCVCVCPTQEKKNVYYPVDSRVCVFIARAGAVTLLCKQRGMSGKSWRQSRNRVNARWGGLILFLLSLFCFFLFLFYFYFYFFNLEEQKIERDLLAPLTGRYGQNLEENGSQETNA